MDFLQRTPFLRLLLPLLIGIIMYQYLPSYQFFMIVLMGLAVLLFILSFFVRNPKFQYQFRWLFGVGVSFAFTGLGFFLSYYYASSSSFESVGEKAIFRVELVSSPIEKAKSYLCEVSVNERLDVDGWKPTSGKAVVYVQKDSSASQLLYGDILLLEAKFSPPQSALNPGAFDYASYLRRQGVGATTYVSGGRWRKVGRNENFSVIRLANQSRESLLSIYRKFDIEGDEFAVLAALTLGYTDALEPDLRKSYSATGVMHILAVSGMHVGVVYLVLAFLFSFLDKSKQLKIVKSVLIVLFLWMYAFITGLSPSVVRASLMFTFVAIALCLGRKSLVYNTIFMSAFIMLIFRPATLFDIGFQLSYAAVLSIIYFYPLVSKLYKPPTKLMHFVWSLTAMSVAAQLGTTPFTLYYFHQFPNYFLFSNFIAVPLSSLIIYLSIALLFLSFVPFVSVFLAILLKGLLALLNFLIVWIEELPHSTSIYCFDIWQVGWVFVAIFCLSFYLHSKAFTPLCMGLCAILFAVLIDLSANIKGLNTRQLLVYAARKNTHIAFVNGKDQFVLSTDSVNASAIMKPNEQIQKLNKAVFVNNTNWLKDGFCFFENKRIYILQKDMLQMQNVIHPFELDYLIIGNGLKPDISELIRTFRPRKIIVDSSISTWYTERIREVCLLKEISFYAVAEQGAYHEKWLHNSSCK